jgi:uncharacterized protein (UPF0276 family)
MRASRNAPIRLHDLATDLAHQHDLAEEHPDVVSDLVERMNSIRDRSK